MNILFLTLVEINNIQERGIYQDLLRKFINEGHSVTIVSPVERRKKTNTYFSKNKNYNLLKVKTLNITKANLIEKGIGTLAIEYQFLFAIKKYCSALKFDLILYSTPPITFSNIITYIKKKDGAHSYLLLKDIFPQNAVDMKMLKKGGLLHKLFLKKEKILYNISDTIGCMSEANRNYILKHNSYINPEKVEVNPNSIEPIDITYTDSERIAIRTKYGLPINKTIFVYGGNLGKPQGLNFLVETIENIKEAKAFFLIVGDGTEYQGIFNWIQTNRPNNAKLFQKLPKEDYDTLLGACDVGLIFLNANFLIPNFPSRLLSYLEMRKPIIAATDSNTDIGDIIEKAKCGYKVLSGDNEQMKMVIDEIINKVDLTSLGENAWNLLQNEYLVERSYSLIINRTTINSSIPAD